MGIIDELCAPEYVYHMAGLPPQGREAFKEFMKQLYFAIPDFHMEPASMIAEGDTVVTRWTTSGTQKGEFLGIPATGKRFEFDGVLIVRFQDGKEVEAFEVADRLTMLQQLGVAPPMGA
jgi:steroid delta-isomerase-like uncharacterized protein